MRNGHSILLVSLLASITGAACSAATQSRSSGTTGSGGSGGSAAATGGGGAASSTSTTSSTSGASSSGHASSSSSGRASSSSSSSGHASSSSSAGSSSTSTTGSSSSGSGSSTTSSSGNPTGLPASFDGGWQIPDPGMMPAAEGDGGTTVVIGPGASSGSPGKFGGPATGTAPSIVYPPTGVMVPPNTNTMEFHFIPAAGQTLFQLTFHAPTTTLEVFTGCTAVGAGCVYTVDPTFWSSLVAYARGTTPVTYTIKGVNAAGVVGTSATQTIAFDQQDMTGGIYYWNTGGTIQRYDYGFPNAPAQQYFTPQNAQAFFCVGCHVLSRQGDQIAVAKDIPAPSAFEVFDVVSKAPEMVGGQAVTGAASFYSFSPDGRFLLKSDGVSITWMNVGTNTLLPGPVAASGTMPDWSPDGLHLVYAEPSSPAFFAVPGVSSASISMLHFNGSGWDSPTTLVPFNGQNNYYPAFSPSGSYVIFDRSPSNAESFGNASPDPDAGTVPDGELWAVATAGGSPVRLSAASNPGECSWPKWAPVLHDYYGGKVMWFTFSSLRAYGLRLPAGQETQLWMAAFDPAKAAAGQDPSFPAFWLPFQDMGSGNHIAQWSTKVPRASCSGSGQSTCNAGEICVNGGCRPS